LADQYDRLAEQTAQAVNDLAAIMRVSNVTSVHTLTTGQWRRAQTALERSAEIAERLGDRRIWEGDTAGLAHIAHHRGEFARSEKLWRALRESAQHSHNDQTEAWGLLGQAENLLRLGLNIHAEQAVELVGAALPLLAKGVDRGEAARAYGSLALAHTRLGQRDLAGAALKQAIRLVMELQLVSFGVFGGYFNIAETILRLIEDESDSPRRTELLNLSAQMGKALERFTKPFPIGRPRAAVWLGLDAWLRGNPALAARLWQKGLAQAGRLGMPYEIALAEYEIGRHATGLHRQARLTRARSLFAECGAQWERKKIDEDLRL
jgi:tetratricopeptide (TPR) repeat protein